MSAIWPPTGIALAAVVLGGYEMLPAVALAALLADLTTAAPLGAGLGITVGSTLEAFAGAWLLRRARLDSSLRRMRDVLAIVVLAGGVSTVISATIGTASLAVFGGLDGVHLVGAWRTWWLGDMGGDLLVATAILVFARVPRSWLLSADAVKTLLLTLLLALVTILVLRYDSAFPYLVLAPLLLVALLCGERGAVLGGLVVSAIAVWLTVRGHGSFAGADHGARARADGRRRTLRALKALGVRVVLDDFGTGYSSLGYLRQLPIDAVKIERTVVRELDTDTEARAVTTAVLSMAGALDIGVTAEGVENHSQFSRLRSLGCEFAQGYLFARPAPPAEIGAMLEESASLRRDRVTA